MELQITKRKKYASDIVNALINMAGFPEEDAISLVSKIPDVPTIEAEPVVRCKDCKYSKKFNITGNRYCDFHRAYEYPVSDDDYCSNGAKMDLEVK